jgi:hypothetical protein
MVRKYQVLAAAVLAVSAGCTSDERPPLSTSGEPAGAADCAGAQPGPGCPCSAESALTACALPTTLDERGDAVCTRGSSVCKEGVWSECSATSTRRVPAAALTQYRALISRDAAPVACDPCDPDCYVVEDPMDALPDGGAELALGDSGGLTIAFDADGGAPVVAPPAADAGPCVPQTAPDYDCDGIPDGVDPLPGVPNSTGSQRTIFMGIPAGSAGSQTLDTDFRLNSADLYMLLDMSTDGYGASAFPDPGSVYPDADGQLYWGDLDPVRPMGAFKNGLAAALTSGNFLDGESGITCADINGDGTPDDALKSQGIAGNLACLIPGIAFGAGWFRDIPFQGPYDHGQYVASDRTILFRNDLDITASANALAQSVARFSTTENIVSPSDSYYGNEAEGSSQALWALASGGELYAGWSRPGIPARTDCPQGTWGYPCFRDGAMPIVLHVTDAPLQNGPRRPLGDGVYTGRGCLDDFSAATCSVLDYDDDVLASTAPGTRLSAAPDGRYHALTNAAESFADAEPVGELTTDLVTYVLDTTAMAADVSYSTPNCGCSSATAWDPWDEASPDVVFRFTVTNPPAGLPPPLLISGRGSDFDASIMVVRANAAGTLPAGPGPCIDDSVGSTWIPELLRPFADGTYFAIVKGYAGSSKGRLQLTFGNPTLASPARFDARPWSGTGSVRSALVAHDVRVIGMCVTPSGDCASDNPYTWEQSVLLASDTSATATDGSPLAASVRPYSNNVADIGRPVVRAVQALVAQRSMDVSLRLRQQPDDPTPDFRFSAEAIDTPSDACDPPVDTDADGLPDLHVNCRPGARPRFRVTFVNPPVPSNVPPNPADRSGGYSMTLDLLGNGSYVLDQIPVYLVPEEVTSAPPVQPYLSDAVYEQTLWSTGCLGNEAPLWRLLGWEATVPSGTELDWDMCLAETEAGLDTCTYSRVGTVQSGGPCTIDSQCDDGYCDASNACHFVTGPVCTADADCGDMGRCIAGPTESRCMWTGNPVALAPSLVPGTQGFPFARVRVTLRANTSRTLAPTVNRYRVEYVCAPLR